MLNFLNLFLQNQNQGLRKLGTTNQLSFSRSDIATWVLEGKLQHREDIQEGIENCPQTLNRLFTGENKGKQLLKI